MWWKNKSVCVSGGAGVIGKSLVAELLSLGAKVTVGDLKPRLSEFPDSVTYRQGDLNTLAPNEWKCDVFFHLAATFERSEESSDFFDPNWIHNVTLSHHLATRVDCNRVVFASSYLVYDPAHYFQQQVKPLIETSSLNPRNLCGASKLYHEKELLFLGKSSVAARIFRVYGRGSKDVISRWIDDARNKIPLELFAAQGKFDYIFAEDVAKGLILLAQTQAQGAVNLGYGKNVAVAEVVEEIKSHFPNITINHKSSTIPLENSCADISLLKKLTGWSPQVSLKEGIARLVHNSPSSVW
jgi:carbamoyl-phosphate synthase large subunit